MSPKIYIIIGAVVIIVLGGLLFLQSGETPQTPAVEKQAVVATGVSHTVTLTDTGYSPRELTVQKGDTVVFLNESSRGIWPATAIHPTHTIYPGSNRLKCGTQEGMFDACGSVASGASWSFVFGEQGSWGYHDHLNVSNTGKITVQ